MAKGMKVEAIGNSGDVNVLQINNYQSTDNLERDFDIIGECRNLKRLASQEDFDVHFYQDQIWRIADRIQLLIEAA